MLDSIVKLTEKITELVQYRSEKRARAFDKLVEPMYESLKLVHKDYLSIFETTKKELASGVRLTDVADSLSSRRLTEEAERRAILQHAETLTDDKALSAWQTFFTEVMRYFYRTPFSKGSTPSNMLLHRLQDAQETLLRPSRHTSDARDNLLWAIDMTIEQLRENWERVSCEHAKSLASSLK